MRRIALSVGCFAGWISLAHANSYDDMRGTEFSLRLERAQSTLNIDHTATASTVERVGVAFGEHSLRSLHLNTEIGQAFVSQKRTVAYAGAQLAGPYLTLSLQSDSPISVGLRWSTAFSYTLQYVEDRALTPTAYQRTHTLAGTLGVSADWSQYVTFHARGGAGMVQGTQYGTTSGAGPQNINGKNSAGALLALDLEVDRGGFVEFYALAGMTRGAGLRFIRAY